jgi:hypothetical protein
LYAILIVPAEVVFLEQFVDAGTSSATEYVVAESYRSVSAYVTAMCAVQMVVDRMRVLLVHVTVE